MLYLYFIFIFVTMFIMCRALKLSPYFCLHQVVIEKYIPFDTWCKVMETRFLFIYHFLVILFSKVSIIDMYLITYRRSHNYRNTCYKLCVYCNQNLSDSFDILENKKKTSKKTNTCSKSAMQILQIGEKYDVRNVFKVNKKVTQTVKN